MTAYLILIRGLPGSGKSTLAKKFKHVRHIEADMFFMVNDEYKFDPSRLKDAHDWCQKAARDALAAGVNVVVSNTFSRIWEMQPYLDMTDNVTVLTCEGNHGNIHNVPFEAIKRMRARWERYG